MPAFGQASEAKLATVDRRLVDVLRLAIRIMDFTVIEGHRGEAAQNAAFATGKSKLKYPHGNHNATPSRAVDIAPFPVDWSDNQKSLERFVFLQGIVCACAFQLGVKVRFGLDWNGNHDMRDEGKFRDYPHVELVDP